MEIVLIILGSVALCLLIGCFAMLFYKKKSLKVYKDKDKVINLGMSQNEVLAIMGQPYLNEVDKDGFRNITYILSIKKSLLSGEKVLRKLKIIISQADEVISVSKIKDKLSNDD